MNGHRRFPHRIFFHVVDPSHRCIGTLGMRRSVIAVIGQSRILATMDVCARLSCVGRRSPLTPEQLG